MNIIYESIQKLSEEDKTSGEREIAEKHASGILKDVEQLARKQRTYDIASVLFRVRKELDNILKPQEDAWADEL